MIADYANSISFSELSGEVIHEVKRRMIDSVGCYFGAWNSEPSRISRKTSEKFRGSEYSATLWGTGEKVSADWAAFSNAVGVRYLDFNDTYLSREPLHPSDMIPSIFAAAEASRRDGREFITAVAIAYEVGCRLCDSISLRTRGWDHVNFTMLGAVAGVGKILGLGVKELENAVSLAVVPHVAMRQTRAGELSMWKGAAAANACRNAFFAAVLAAGGFTGPSQPFEGEMGFFRQVLGGESLDFSALEALESSESPTMINRTYIKYHPVEYHAQSAVDAALRLSKEIRDIEEIEEIVVETFEAAYTIIAKDPEKWKPKTRETADHSLPFIVAATLSDGKIWLDSFEPQKLGSQRVLKLLGRMRVIEVSELTSRYPSEIPNRIRVKLRDGRELVEEVGVPRGHWKNPMTDQEVEGKFHRLVAGFFSEAERREILRVLWKLDKLSDLREVTEVLELRR